MARLILHLFAALTLWQSQYHGVSEDAETQTNATILIDSCRFEAYSTVEVLFVL